MKILTLLGIFIANTIIACPAIAGEFAVVVDRPTLIGISYGKNGMPGPFQGTWILRIRYPSNLEKPSTYTWSWKQKDENTVSVDCSIKYSRDDGTTYLIPHTDQFIIDLANWSNGMYDKAQRDEIVEKKVLLDYHKIPAPVCKNGLVPDRLSITKHVIGYREGDEVTLVVYQADDMEIIRKFHRPPTFFQWGRNLDQSYHIEDNKNWLKLSKEKSN
jgi:hypothetical protein